MLNHLRSLVSRGEAGQTNVEYGMIVTLISVAAMTVLMFVGDELVADFTEIKDKLLSVL